MNIDKVSLFPLRTQEEFDNTNIILPTYSVKIVVFNTVFISKN